MRAKPALMIVVGAVLLVAAVAGASRLFAAPAPPTVVASPNFLPLPPDTKGGQVALWGHIKSLSRKGGRFEMRFDPAWLLHGVTASRAALEDTGSSDVPNDYYIVDEGHRLLTYVVPAAAHVTVLTKGLRSTSITVSELAQIVKGRNPKHRPLFDTGNHLGFWIRVGSRYPNPALSIDQQYQP
jgi:hypothetical protein